VPLGPHGEAHELARVAVIARLAALRRQVQNHGARYRDRRVLGVVVSPLGGEGEALLQILDRRDRLVVVLELLLELPQSRVAAITVTDLHRAADQLGDRGCAAMHRPDATPAGFASGPAAASTLGGEAEMTSIDLAQLKGLLADGAQLVEVLPAEEYAEEHLPGAINIPLKELDAESAAQLDRSKAIVVYCWDGL
jgi:hypothetical protein